MQTTRETLQRAVYQYLVDHSFPHKDGIAVSFIIPKEADFKRRVLAREKGYKRQDLETLDITFKDFLTAKGEAMEKLRIMASCQSKHQKKINKLKQNGSLKIRFIIWLREYLTTKINRAASNK